MSETSWRERPVAGIGIVGLDHVAVTDSWERDGKSVASHYFEQVGGPVPVALMAMARFGLTEAPRLCGVIGLDDGDAQIRRILHEANVSDTLLSSDFHYDTPRSVVVLQGDTRTLTSWDPGAKPDLSHEQIGGLRGCGLLHVDGRDVREILSAIEIVREHEAVISLDLGSFREQKATLFAYCNIVIASKPGGAGAFPDVADSPVEQTKRFLDAGATVAGVTLGADGVIIGCRDENGGVPVHLPAFHVENIVDTCGAGDLFHGAFLWAYREGRGVFDAATFAQAAVAVRIQRYNNSGQPTHGDVEVFLAANTSG